MQINDLIMIEVVLLCHLLALALNIPHLGCDRPSDPDLLHPSVPGAHSGKKCCMLCITFVYYICVLHFTIVCYMFCMFQCGATFTVYCMSHFWGPRRAKSSCVSLCGVTFWHPMWDSKALGGMGDKWTLLSHLHFYNLWTSVKELFNHISLWRCPYLSPSC